MLSSVVSRSTATGNDSTATYNFNYRIFAMTDLLVTVRNTTTQVETKLTLTTDYTVTGVGLQAGSISLVSAGQAWIDGSGFLAAGYLIVIRRVRPLTQNTSIRNQGTFYAAVHEDTFDNLTMEIQQHDDMLQRAVILPETVLSSAFNPVLPLSIVNPPAGAALVVNGAQNGWALGSPIVGFKSVTIPFSNFKTGALTNQFTAFTLPASGILMAVAMKHSVAFSGGSISSLALDLGISVGNPDNLIKGFDVFQSVSDTAFISALVQTIQSFSNPTNILVKATAVGANLSALTAGSVTIYYWYLNLNQGS